MVKVLSGAGKRLDGRDCGRVASLDVVPPNVCLMFVIAAFCYL
jgi:hypothetical protein